MSSLFWVLSLHLRVLCTELLWVLQKRVGVWLMLSIAKFSPTHHFFMWVTCFFVMSMDNLSKKGQDLLKCEKDKSSQQNLYFKNAWCLFVIRTGEHIHRRKKFFMSTQNCKQRWHGFSDRDATCGSDKTSTTLTFTIIFGLR